MRKMLFGVAVAIAVSGCAFNPQKASLAPVVNVAESNIGNGATVGFRVVDERVNKSLGRRGTAYGAAAEITTDQDVAALVQEKVKEGLTRKGFTVVDFSAPANASLTLELRALEYSTSQGFWTGGVNVDGAIKAIAARPGDSYERMYRADSEHRVVVVPTAGKNSEWINSALSELLGQVFEDVGLFRFLSTTPPQPVSTGE
jgi:uncharacterized lipoprotein YajG